MTHFVFLLQVSLEVLHLLAQQFIHLQLLLYHSFQLLDIGVHIVVHETDALDGGDEFALLGKQLGILFDCGHVSREHLLLLLQDTRYLFLKGKELLFVVSTHRALHCADVFTHLLLVLVTNYILNLNLFLNPLCLLRRSYLWRRSGLFDGVCPVFVLVQQHLLHLFSVLYLLYLLWNFLRNCFGCFLGLGWLFFFEWIDDLRWKLIRPNLRLKNLFAILWGLWRSIIRQTLSMSCTVIFAFFFLDGLGTLYLLDRILLDINATLTLHLILRLVLPLNAVVDLIVFFTQLGLVLQPFGVAKGVETVVCRGTAGRDACDHDDPADLCLGDEGVPEDEGEFGGSEGYVIGLVVHSTDAFLEGQQTAYLLRYLLLISAPSIRRCRLLL